MSEVTEAPAKAASSVGEGLKKKLGPLPVWGWILVGGTGIGLFLFIRSRAGGGAASSPFGVLPPGSFGGSGTPSGSSTTTPTTTTTTTPTSNSAWLSSVDTQVANLLQLPVSEVDLYLNQYLSGLAPTGSQAATTAYQQVINAALGISAPPIAPSLSSPGVSPYTSQSAWWNEILTFLPAGTSQSVIGELNALFNGQTTSISQDAANALSAAESVVGLGPNGLIYTISSNVVPTVTGTINSLTSSSLNSWVNQTWAAYGSLATTNPSQYASSWISAFTASFGTPTNLSTGIWNAVNSQINSWYQNGVINYSALTNIINQQISLYNSNPGAYGNPTAIAYAPPPSSSPPSSQPPPSPVPSAH